MSALGKIYIRASRAPRAHVKPMRAGLLVALMLAVAAAVTIALDGASTDAPARNQHTPGTNSSPPVDVKVRYELDAFNLNLCGNAHFRPWQRRQSAFGCRLSRLAGAATPSVTEDDEDHQNRTGDVTGESEHRPRQAPLAVGNKIYGGELALPGEFPFHVQLYLRHFLDTPKNVPNCGATLIHSDLAVTAAHCTPPFGYGVVGKAVLGTNELSGAGGTEVKLNKWCRYSKYHDENDLAIVRLSRPVKYQIGKIQPACLTFVAPTMGAVCAFAGLGVSDEASRYQPQQLKTLRAYRGCRAYKPGDDCYLSYPRGDHTTLYGDSGSALYCYETCELERKTRAFAVAAVSHGPPEPKYWPKEMFVASFHRMRATFDSLLMAIRTNKSVDGIQCGDMY